MSIEQQLKHTVRSDRFVKIAKFTVITLAALSVIVPMALAMIYLDGPRDKLSVCLVILLFSTFSLSVVWSMLTMYAPLVKARDIVHLHKLALKHDSIARWVAEAVADNKTLRKRDLLAAAFQDNLIKASRRAHGRAFVSRIQMWRLQQHFSRHSHAGGNRNALYE